MTLTLVSVPADTASLRSVGQRTGLRLGVLSAIVGAAVLSGCVVPPGDGGYAHGGYYESNTVVYTQYGSPPPPRVEYRTVSPYADYVWVGGDWVWGGRRYDWRPGRWEPPHRAPLWREPSRPGWREPSRPGWNQPAPPRQRMQQPPPRPEPDRGRMPPRHMQSPGAGPDAGPRPQGMRPDAGRPMPAPPPAARPPQPQPAPQVAPPQQAAPDSRPRRTMIDGRRDWEERR